MRTFDLDFGEHLGEIFADSRLDRAVTYHESRTASDGDSNKEEDMGSQLVDWEVVQLDKRCGGLGIRDLRMQSNDEM
uniref:Uncharacterized protein n=1 Tax=Solanum lycopersicum TaxID=4081 RepID=A0A3Q7HB28_SOLLC